MNLDSIFFKLMSEKVSLESRLNYFRGTSHIDGVSQITKIIKKLVSVNQSIAYVQALQDEEKLSINEQK